MAGTLAINAELLAVLTYMYEGDGSFPSPLVLKMGMWQDRVRKCERVIEQVEEAQRAAASTAGEQAPQDVAT